MKMIKSMNLFLQLDSKKPESVSLPLNLFRLRVNQLVQQFTVELGVSHVQVKLKSMRSRWGSCSRRGVITINTRLKNLPEIFLAFVVFHECLHLVHMNHGRDFKSLMLKKFPNKKELEQQLRLFGLRELS